MDSSKQKMINERIKKGFKNLENKRKTLVFNYEFKSKLIERNKTCSATVEEEQKKLLSEFRNDCDRLQAE
ncbi:hypothetical protein H5410_030369 [Solanum commersonii]|uniref:Uncharacterized protein n=1 Tax=Solanum commersonii TaxID=4109 RepID=A0A9J5YGN5_SOLCO|nr:hypothetical protein H5410_030369 [Solanum commersonii]